MKNNTRKRNPGPRRWQVPIENTRLNHGQFLQIAYGFCLDDTAVLTARQSRVSQRTVNGIYRLLRARLVELHGDSAMQDGPDMNEVMAYHRERQARSPGWRFDSLHSQVMESVVRLNYRQWGPYWLFYTLLASLYEQPLKRPTAKQEN